MANYSELALKIIELIGGGKNITEAWHCVTRLRFNVVDSKKVKIDDIKQLKGVMGAQFSGSQFQVIIGNDVSNVFEEVSKQLGDLVNTNNSSSNKNESIVSKFMDMISGIFTPALPAIVGTGLLKGFLALFVALGWMADTSTGYAVLNIVADCAFYFLPFLLAVSSARRFKTNEYLALCLAGTMLYPTMTDGYNALIAGGDVASMQLFGIIPIPFLAYSSSVIPIILAVWCLKYVYNFVKKVMPKVLSTMFTPMVTLLIVIPLTLVVFGPVGTYIGAILGGGLTWLFDHVGFIAAALVGACYPLLVMTGMHWALMPIMLTSFNTLGYDASMAPAMLAATFSMAGATFGVFLKSKDDDMKQLSLSSGISALLGITEPAMYGVTLKLKKPFYAAMLGGGVAGLIMNIFKVKNYGMAMPGLIALAGYVDKNNGMNIVIALIGSVVAFVIALVITWLLGFQGEDKRENKEVLAKGSSAKGETKTIFSPVSGDITPIETVSDATFSQQIMGYTSAIKPDDNNIYSPVTGEVVLISETNHAIGLKSDDGVEILIHIGIDTVELKGEGFSPQVIVGDHVAVGDLLMKVDVKKIVETGYDSTVMTIITNSQDYLDILSVTEKDTIHHGEAIASVVK